MQLIDKLYTLYINSRIFQSHAFNQETKYSDSELTAAIHCKNLNTDSANLKLNSNTNIKLEVNSH